MSRNNTGNPIGSKAFPDFEDNVKNLDEAVNTADPQWVDRFGRFRLPLMEQERQFVASQDSREDQFQSAQSSREAVFSDFLQASGYQDLGEYAPGIEITAHNQYVTFGGQPYLLKPSIPVPYTTSGEWTGDDFKLIGDDSLRQDLANPDKGAAMVARGVVAVDSVGSLLALPEGQRREGLRYLVKGYHAGSDVGGGSFYWDATRPKGDHTGGTVISPSVPPIQDQPGGSLDERLANFLGGLGETEPGGFGCFVKESSRGEIDLAEFGALDSSSDISAVLKKCLELGKVTVICRGSYLSSDLVSSLSGDVVFVVLGSLHFTGEVSTSYFPYGLEVQAGGHDLKICGNGVIDWENWDAPTIRRRTVFVSGAGVGIVRGIKSRSARFIIHGDRVELSGIHILSNPGTVHDADATGFLKAGDYKNGALICNNRIVASTSKEDFVKASGAWTTVFQERAKSAVIKDNYFESTSDVMHGEIDIYNGGSEAIIRDNTLHNVTVHSKSYGGLEGAVNSQNNNVSILDNRFIFTRDTVGLPIYRRGGMCSISGNDFTARIDLTNLRQVIQFDTDSLIDSDILTQQNDIQLNNNTVNFRKVTKDDVSFVFAIGFLVAGTDRASLTSVANGNIVVGMNGLLRGPLFDGCIAADSILDMQGRVNWAAGNLHAKRADNIVILGANQLLDSNALVVSNSPGIVQRHNASPEVVGGVLDVQGRSVVILTSDNVGGTVEISGLINHPLQQPLTFINRSGATLTFRLYQATVTSVPTSSALSVVVFVVPGSVSQRAVVSLL